MLLVRRRDGLSREQFREYYETKHAVLAASSMPKCVRYVRNFVQDEPSGPQDFDVITEFWFDVEGSWDEAIPAMTDHATRQMLAVDEANFMDRASMRVVTVAECETDPATLSANQ